MTYAIGRPAWAVATAVRATTVTHLANGWSAFEGTETACGGRLKNPNVVHLTRRTASALMEAFEGGKACARCARKIEEKRNRDRGTQAAQGLRDVQAARR